MFQTSCRKRTAKYISLKQVAGNKLQNNLDLPKTKHTVCHYVGNLMKWFDEVNLGSLDSFRMTKNGTKKSLENSNDFK